MHKNPLVFQRSNDVAATNCPALHFQKARLSGNAVQVAGAKPVKDGVMAYKAVIASQKSRKC
jgi:hypothetical protein